MTPDPATLQPRDAIREKYNRMGRWYDWGNACLEVLGVRRLRRELLRSATGETLEVGVGTGANLGFYPPVCRLTGVDLSPVMLGLCRRRARRLGRPVVLSLMDAQQLGFPEGTFDTVVDTLSLCTIPDPVVALREMKRVCRPGGQILLLEHGRSSRERVGRWQDRTSEAHARRFCCHWNREPHRYAARAGLQLEHWRRNFLGIFHLMRARC